VKKKKGKGERVKKRTQGKESSSFFRKEGRRLEEDSLPMFLKTQTNKRSGERGG